MSDVSTRNGSTRNGSTSNGSTPDWQSAQQAFRNFVDRIPKTASAVAVHDSDADGLTAGAVWQRALERAGFQQVTRVIPDRERNAWTRANRERIAAASPDFLFVMDLGSQTEPVLERRYSTQATVSGALS